MKTNVVKKTHPAGVSKIKCLGCKIGVAVLRNDQDGKYYQCDRCGRKFSASSI